MCGHRHVWRTAKIISSEQRTCELTPALMIRCQCQVYMSERYRFSARRPGRRRRRQHRGFFWPAGRGKVSCSQDSLNCAYDPYPPQACAHVNQVPELSGIFRKPPITNLWTLRAVGVLIRDFPSE